jgi:hypothetical protein
LPCRKAAPALDVKALKGVCARQFPVVGAWIRLPARGEFPLSLPLPSPRQSAGRELTQIKSSILINIAIRCVAENVRPAIPP